MRSFVRQLRQAKEEDEEFIRKDVELKTGGTGTFPNDNRHDFLRNVALETLKGLIQWNKMLEWARVNDKTSYEAIKKKSAEGLLANKSFFEWSDTFDKEGRSIIGRTIQRQNEQIRRRARGE